MKEWGNPTASLILNIGTRLQCVISFNPVRFEVLTAVTMKNGVFWDVTPRGFVRTDVSEELIPSTIRVTIIGELGTTLAVTSNRRTHSSQRPSVASYG
jgi:hypothetical protein